MILNVSGISKSFVEERILQCVSFHVEDYEKAAIVGINGAGKTTLLRIIVGEMAPDEGLVTISKGKTLGYLKQNDAVNSENTIYDELLGVKKDLTDMEKQLREYEGLMNTLTGSIDASFTPGTKIFSTPPAFCSAIKASKPSAYCGSSIWQWVSIIYLLFVVLRAATSRRRKGI